MLHITSIFTLLLPQSRNKTHSHLMFLHQTAPSGFSLLRGSARFGGSSTALLSYLWYFVHAECLFIAREIHTFRGAILRDVINGLLIDAFRLQEARKLDSDFIISHWLLGVRKCSKKKMRCDRSKRRFCFCYSNIQLTTNKIYLPEVKCQTD